MGGNRGLYRRLLTRFADSEADACARIRAALAAGERDLAVRHAHTVKGVAANLGILGVQGAAAAVEQALKDGRSGDPELSALSTGLDQVVLGLRRLAPAAPARAITDPAADLAAHRSDLGRLRTLLANDDTAAGDLAERLATATGHPGLAEVHRLTGEFDFAAALKRLHSIAPEGTP